MAKGLSVHVKLHKNQSIFSHGSLRKLAQTGMEVTLRREITKWTNEPRKIYKYVLLLRRVEQDLVYGYQYIVRNDWGTVPYTAAICCVAEKWEDEKKER